MNRYNKRAIALAACLSGLAGFVDAIGFIELSGFFVSFMSGNSTRFSVSLAEGAENAGLAGGLIGIFVGGVVLGSLIGRIAGVHRRAAVLALVATLLVVAAAFASSKSTAVTIVVMVLAMGAENAVFEQDGEVQIGLTYMTGTLVKAGQRIAAAIAGGERFAWLPYLLLWAGLVLGAFAGAKAHAGLGLEALWIAAAAAVACTLASLEIRLFTSP